MSQIISVIEHGAFEQCATKSQSLGVKDVSSHIPPYPFPHIPPPYIPKSSPIPPFPHIPVPYISLVL